jgi:quercetin dioxygenase-like cupin family protein
MTPQDFQTHHFATGIYAKEMRVPAGIKGVTHVHTYDHFAFLCKGRAIVEVDGKRTEYQPGSIITIVRGKQHSVFALDDIIWFCVHATDVTDPTKIDKALIVTEG